VGPVWRGGTYKEEELLSLCYKNSLDLAQEYHLRSISFPSISTGAYRFPIKIAAGIALNTVKTFLDKDPNILEKVIFVLFSDQDFEIYKGMGL
jgi:O-acetyl-ADP-ribose deacetylase (regulator of RNase III)